MDPCAALDKISRLIQDSDYVDPVTRSGILHEIQAIITNATTEKNDATQDGLD
jgi:hypothetical protein